MQGRWRRGGGGPGGTKATFRSFRALSARVGHWATKGGPIALKLPVRVPLEGMRGPPGRGRSQEASEVKVWIEQEYCTGDGLCEELCPAVFEMGDDGLAHESDVLDAQAQCAGECIYVKL